QHFSNNGAKRVDFLTPNFSACFSVIISLPMQLFTVRDRPDSVPVACLIKKNQPRARLILAIALEYAFRLFPDLIILRPEYLCT
ncbi:MULTISPECIES: hypothetical protein, partial [unclassified Microcoleus]|uniref:hypothetical protein n=1 Tax=unclassified Microcoleus TaxID=2642155 RepID=UPI002FD48C2B